MHTIHEVNEKVEEENGEISPNQRKSNQSEEKFVEEPFPTEISKN